MLLYEEGADVPNHLASNPKMSKVHNACLLMYSTCGSYGKVLGQKRFKGIVLNKELHATQTRIVPIPGPHFP